MNQKTLKLRCRAEEQLAQRQGSALLGEGDARRTLHELQVHRLELEMQNEELRQTHVELDAARERYFNLYDRAPVGYCTVSQAGLILQANLTAAALLGVARGALTERPIGRFILREDQDIYSLAAKRLLKAGDPQTCELRMLKNDGRSFWVHLVATAVHEEDGAPVIRIVLSDVSERKRAEQSLIAAREEADRANHAKSAFLSRMSHELRTPLNVILGFGELLEMDPDFGTPDQRASLAHILSAGHQLLGLVNDLLELSGNVPDRQ